MFSNVCKQYPIIKSFLRFTFKKLKRMLINYFQGLHVCKYKFFFEKTQNSFIPKIKQMLAKVCVFHMITKHFLHCCKAYSCDKPRGLFGQCDLNNNYFIPKLSQLCAKQVPLSRKCSCI